MNFFYPPQPMRIWPNAPLFGRLSSSPDWVGEIKYNDWRIQIHHSEKFLIYNRHNTIINIDHKIFLPYFKDIPKDSIFDGGLLNFRTSDIKNVIVIWDAMFFGGKDLRKMPLQQRRKYLEDFKEIPDISKLKSLKNGQVFRNKQYKTKLKELYNRIVERDDPMEEGIVLKDLKSGFEYSLKGSFDTSKWIKIKKKGDHTFVEKH